MARLAHAIDGSYDPSMFEARRLGFQIGMLFLVGACGARTEINANADHVPSDIVDSDAAGTNDAAAVACGGSGQPCCGGSGCGVGLACNGGTCTVLLQQGTSREAETSMALALAVPKPRIRRAAPPSLRE